MVCLTQTVFLALESTITHFWVHNKEGKASHRRNELKGENAINSLECARKDAFKEYLDARVTRENRSLVELRDKSSPSRLFVEERVEAFPCNSISLRFFHDCIIAPIADLLEGDELSIVPDGPLCLAP